MSEAPERIWAGNWLADVGETATWDIGEWRDEPWPTVDVVEYVRADLVKELEAKLAELERAAKPFAAIKIKDGMSQPGEIGRTDVTNIRAALAELTGGKDE